MENVTNKKEVIKKIAQQLIDGLKIKAVAEVEEKEEIFEVKIETEESGLFIGYHGNTLYSFQLILSTLVFNKLETWEKIVVDVGDYRQKREESIKNMARQFAEQVLATKQPLILPYFPSFERRIIHLTLKEYKELVSESSGEGKDRKITVQIKSV